jgi:glycosyltransferase involved in cell wall biosynthesis
LTNLLHIYQNSNVGGVQQQLFNVIKNYDKNTITPSFACIKNKGQIAEELEESHIPVFALNQPDYNDFTSSVKRLKDIIEKNNINLIRTHRFIANFYGRIAAILTGKPVIISLHDNYNKDKRIARRIINRVLALKTSKIVAVSHSIKDDIIKYDGINPDKINVIHNGIDLNRFNPNITANYLKKELGIEEGEKVIGFVGRLVPAKAIDKLIEAFAMIKRQNNDIKLLIVGFGELFEELNELTNHKKLDGHVIFTGKRRDIPQLLSIMDIFVMPSISEGLPNVLIEAMAAAKPIISTKAGGIPEIITNLDNGILIDNDINSLYQTINNLLENKDLATTLGLNARKYAETHLDIKIVSKKWENLYKEVLKK